MTGRICLGRNLAKEITPPLGEAHWKGILLRGILKGLARRGYKKGTRQGNKRGTRQREYSRGYYKGDRAPARGFC
jgi:hypothetical protein